MNIEYKLNNNNGNTQTKPESVSLIDKDLNMEIRVSTEKRSVTEAKNKAIEVYNEFMSGFVSEDHKEAFINSKSLK